MTQDVLIYYVNESPPALANVPHPADSQSHSLGLMFTL